MAEILDGVILNGTEYNFASSSNEYAGKTINFEGDSITQALRDNGVGWVKRCANILGMTATNNGVGGATTQVTADKTSICTNVITRSGSYDYTIIQPSLVNDSPLNLGSITADGNATLDTSTYYGALETMARYAQKYLGKVGIIICYKIGKDSFSSTVNTSRPQAIRDVCDKYGIPYLDLQRNAGFNLCIQNNIERFGAYIGSVQTYDSSKGYAQDEQVRYNGLTYKAKAVISSPAGVFDPEKWISISDSNYDACHCNSLGYEMLTNKVVEFIKSL